MGLFLVSVWQSVTFFLCDDLLDGSLGWLSVPACQDHSRPPPGQVRGCGLSNASVCSLRGRTEYNICHPPHNMLTKMRPGVFSHTIPSHFTVMERVLRYISPPDSLKWGRGEAGGHKTFYLLSPGSYSGYIFHFGTLGGFVMELVASQQTEFWPGSDPRLQISPGNTA